MPPNFDTSFGPGCILANEFAQVRIDIDRKGNGPRLRLEDLQSGKSICLDPLILASLVWASDDSLAAHADPDIPAQAMLNQNDPINER
jgi:hypothetical protein